MDNLVSHVARISRAIKGFEISVAALFERRAYAETLRKLLR